MLKVNVMEKIEQFFTPERCNIARDRMINLPAAKMAKAALDGIEENVLEDNNGKNSRLVNFSNDLSPFQSPPGRVSRSTRNLISIGPIFRFADRLHPARTTSICWRARWQVGFCQ